MKKTKKDKENKAGMSAADQEKSFSIKSYWVDLISYPNDLTVAPTIVVSSTLKRTDTPSAIIYFHNNSDSIGIPGYDSIRNVYYLHYHISAIEVVTQLLTGGNVEYYWKKSGGKEWAGIRLKKEIPVK